MNYISHKTQSFRYGLIISVKASDTRARNLREFSSKFLHSWVDEQYPSNMISKHYHKNLLKNLRKFNAHESPV